MLTWLKSGRYAIRGIGCAIREERNMRIHCIVAIAVISLCIVMGVTDTELALIVLCCAFVICSELANSACERLLDSIKPRIAPQLADIKDMLAGCVLLTSLSAVSIGTILLLPKLMLWFSGALRIGILF